MYYGMMIIAAINNQIETNKVEEVFYCDDCEVEFKESEILEVVEGTHFCNKCNQML